MNACEERIASIDLYLDGELRGDELEAFNRHLEECSSCRKELAERRRFIEQVRAARPLYTPSAKFRAEMAALLAAPAPISRSEREPRDARVIVRKRHTPVWLLWLGSRPMPAILACALAIAGISILWRVSQRDVRANAFVTMAAETHRQELAGNLPLEIKSDSPVEISSWFSGKVPFQFRLPVSQGTDGQPQKYELTGGRLVNFRGTRAAYIAYRMQSQTISLVVTSASTSVAFGGEETVSKGLAFHTHRKGELRVVTWSVHNLTYALVSGVNVPARQSCSVCHASAGERDLMRDLKSLNKQKAGGNNIGAHVFWTLSDEKNHRNKL
jgi:anti-sigma factor RsiW